MNIGNRKKLFLVVMSCVSPGYALAQQITDAAGITYGAPPSIGLNNDLGDGGQGGDIYSKSVDLDFFHQPRSCPERMVILIISWAVVGRARWVEPR